MREWTSVHAFYAGGLDRLLVEGVAPVVSRLREQGAVEQWFFVRYWNGGSHLRVRMRTPSGQAAVVAHDVRAELAAFFELHPGGAQNPHAYRRRSGQMGSMLDRAVLEMGLRDAEPLEPLQPADSTQLRSYAYEAARYGGLAARDFVEGHFCRSTELATAIVAHSLDRLDARTSLAFRLLAALPAALKLSTAAAAELISGFGRMFCEFTREPDVDRPLGESPTALEERRDELMSIVRDAGAGSVPDPSSLAEVACDLWSQELSLCDRELRRLGADGQLLSHPHAVIMSMAHMLNNRLGISAAAEGSLYGLLASALAADREDAPA